MIKKVSSKQVGVGDVDAKKQGASKDGVLEVIPAQMCLMANCTTETATPYSKTSTGHFLCCKKCSEAYYAIPNPLGVWGLPNSPLIRNTDELCHQEPIRRREHLHLVKSSN